MQRLTSQLISSPDGTGIKIKIKQIEIPNIKYIPFKESDLTVIYLNQNFYDKTFFTWDLRPVYEI